MRQPYTAFLLTFYAICNLTNSFAQVLATLDNFLEANARPNGSVNSFDPKSNGKLIIGGDFTQYTSDFKTFSRNRIALIDTNGVLDESFDPGAGFEGFFSPIIDKIQILSSGKIMASSSSGQVDFYDNNPINGFARINPDHRLVESLKE